MYEQASNPQISESTWCLAEAKHRLLPKIRAYSPHKNKENSHADSSDNATR
jgi:hypothetical protein